jgi:hypothetical protein
MRTPRADCAFKRRIFDCDIDRAQRRRHRQPWARPSKIMIVRAELHCHGWRGFHGMSQF